MAEDRSLRRFNGEDEEAGKVLKRWKMWCMAKLLTMKDMTSKNRGAWIYTLLDGKALECCEHLTLDDLTSEQGERNLWDLLEQRFPEKEPLDLMGESLGEVFGLAAKDGESSKDWTSRVKDVFDRCER